MSRWGIFFLLLTIDSMAFAGPRYPDPKTPDQIYQNDRDLMDAIDIRTSFLKQNTSGQMLIGQGNEVTPIWQSQQFVHRTSSVTSANPYTSVNVGKFIPEDTTIPQSDEGFQFLAITVTPLSTAENLHITFHGVCTSTTATTITGAIFQDSGTDAIYSSPNRESGAGTGITISGDFDMPAGTTLATTFKLRIGPSSAAALPIYCNTSNPPNPSHGGVNKLQMAIERMAPQ